MYSMHIIQIGSLSIFVNQLFNKYRNELNIHISEQEDFHDFIVSKAFHDHLNLYYGSKVNNIVFYDIYNVIYKTEKHNIDMYMHNIIKTNKLHFLTNEVCKLLILGETCIIGKNNFKKFISY